MPAPRGFDRNVLGFVQFCFAAIVSVAGPGRVTLFSGTLVPRANCRPFLAKFRSFGTFAFAGRLC